MKAKTKWMAISAIVPLLLIVIFTACCFRFLDYQYVVQHEGAHEIINQYYGFDSTTEIKDNGLFFSGLTKPVGITMERWKQMSGYHALNEIIGYNVHVICIAIILAAGIIGVAIVFRG